MRTPLPRARSRPLPTRRGYTWQGRVALGVSVAAAASMAFVMGIPTVPELPAVGFVTSADRTALLAMLVDLKAAWNPAERERIIGMARHQAEQLGSAMVWLLRHPEHEDIGLA
ncbi:MAG: hypothetical protein KDC98_00915, partial [Planctomycetes bacterium]|nr:hypothetical protein [Planctomycetota bacterium]